MNWMDYSNIEQFMIFMVFVSVIGVAVLIGSGWLLLGIFHELREINANNKKWAQKTGLDEIPESLKGAQKVAKEFGDAVQNLGKAMGGKDNNG